MFNSKKIEEMQKSINNLKLTITQMDYIIRSLEKPMEKKEYEIEYQSGTEIISNVIKGYRHIDEHNDVADKPQKMRMK